MSRWKNVKKRIIAFVIGIVFIIVGLLFLYFDFFGKKDQWYSDTSYYSFAIFFIGIASLLISFEKKKQEPEPPGNSSLPPQS